jgi:hypothetical protein
MRHNAIYLSKMALSVGVSLIYLDFACRGGLMDCKFTMTGSKLVAC